MSTTPQSRAACSTTRPSPSWSRTIPARTCPSSSSRARLSMSTWFTSCSLRMARAASSAPGERVVNHAVVISLGACCWMAHLASSWPCTVTRVGVPPGQAAVRELGQLINKILPQGGSAPAVAGTLEDGTTGEPEGRMIRAPGAGLMGKSTTHGVSKRESYVSLVRAGGLQNPPAFGNCSQLITWDRSTMNEPIGLTETPVVNNPDGLVRAGEPEVENPRTNKIPVSPLWTATPLRAPMAPPSSSPPPPGSEQPGRAFSYFSPSPLHFQATVESAPPTPSTEPVKVGQDDSAAFVLEEGREEGGNEDQMEESGDRKPESSGGVGEPPALVYVQPSPGQLESGVPLTGWLCDPEWLRRRFRDFTLGNMQGNQ